MPLVAGMYTINEPKHGAGNTVSALTTTLANQEQSIMAKPIVRDGALAVNRSHRNADRIAEMYAMYTGGMSLSQVAAAFGITRQSVFGRFRYHGLEMRSVQRLKFVEFNGHRYTPNVQGYFRRTDGDRELLHRDVWKLCHGEIPAGCEIHHRDEDKSNNCINNLECLLGSDHTRHHNPIRPVPAKQCLYCGSQLVRRTFPKNASGTSSETPSAYAKRLFCNPQCAGKFRIGKPRGGKA